MLEAFDWDKISSSIDYRDDEVDFEKEIEMIEGIIDYIVNEVLEYVELKKFK